MNLRRVRLLFVLLALICISQSLVVAQDTASVSGLQIVFSVALKPADINTDAVRAAAQIVARRLNDLNIHPALVQVLAGKAIQVQIPGMDDPQPVIAALTQTALLELVDFSGLSDRVTDFTDSTIITTAWKADPNLPPRDDGQLNPLTNKPFETVLTSADFVTVRTGESSSTTWQIEFGLTDDAGKKFGDFTGSHIGEPLAIALDGKILSIPIIQAQLTTGGVITGNFTEDEAKRLAAEIHAGALPLPLKLTSMETIEAVTAG